MLRPWAAHWIAAVLLCGAVAQYSSDQCNWRGSGLSHESHRRDVEQVYLRCSAGLSGVALPHRSHHCKPAAKHRALIRTHGRSPCVHQTLHLFPAWQRELSLWRPVPQTDISRRITAFQYELVPSQGPGAHMYPYLHSGSVTCKPCSDEEVLMAVCTSDFAGSGIFQGVTSGTNDHAPVVVTLSRLFRQKSRVFAWSGARGRRWSGRINVPSQCGVHPGGDEYLLTGSVHFGGAWLGCAPRYKDFLKLYVRAQKAGTNPCQIDTD
ncbi:Meteorin-like protein [Larimichthys crocea]|uniref:Uncharacterized protein n=1 Tax=Larimichthys crocea TaxID=215358 RepID=A0ACD3RU65_LARCR|nr:Meteorin-like protein [Larimichthys crocea]